jgi:hypothetical protein
MNIRRFLNKKYDGFVNADLALSPLGILATGVAFTIFLAVIYYGLSFLFFSEVIMSGARIASTNPDTTAVHDIIFNGVTKVLPETAEGFTLISPTDIVVNPNDGDFVTVRGVYQVMLPGVKFYENFGGSAAQWMVPVHAQFSFYREY